MKMFASIVTRTQYHALCKVCNSFSATRLGICSPANYFAWKVLFRAPGVQRCRSCRCNTGNHEVSLFSEFVLQLSRWKYKESYWGLLFKNCYPIKLRIQTPFHISGFGYYIKFLFFHPIISLSPPPTALTALTRPWPFLQSLNNFIT
jgi:hypothetical protein